MNLLLRDVRPWGREVTDMWISDGRIAAMERDATGDTASAEVIDGRERIVLPGLVDAHAHLDKTTWGTPYRPHTAGPSLQSLTENERAVRGTLPASVAERAGALLDQYVSLGTTYVRTHVDVDTDAGLESVEGVLEAAAARADRIGVEIVAFPQSGLLVRPGTAELLEDAIKVGTSAGVTMLVGGLDPAGFDRDPVGHLDTVFAIADRLGCGVDIHLHDRGTLGAWEIELIAERTAALGMAGNVTVAHAFALSTVDDARRAALIELLAEHDIAVTTVAPIRMPQLPIKQFNVAGARLGFGNDGVRDLWSPYGNGDMIERAMLVAQASGFRSDDDIAAALSAACYGGAAVCGLDGYGVEVGDKADLVLVDGATLGDIVASRPGGRVVIKAGRVVA
jgi:cytosine/creatinine deaminase